MVYVQLCKNIKRRKEGKYISGTKCLKLIFNDNRQNVEYESEI